MDKLDKAINRTPNSPSREELEKRIGIQASRLSSIFTGAVAPSRDELRLLAKWCGLSREKVAQRLIARITERVEEAAAA